MNDTITFVEVRAEHEGGLIIDGIITGGNGRGVYVQAPNEFPVFCAFTNLKQLTFKH